MLNKRIINILESNGCKVGEIDQYNDEDYYTEIEFYSPAGEDVAFDIQFDGTSEGFIESLKYNAEQFDVDDHVDMWVEFRGKRGVPSSIQELVDDAKWIKSYLEDLSIAISDEDKPEINTDEYTEHHKELSLSIILTSKNTFDVEIYEPESGDFTRINCHDEGIETKMENEKIVNELRAWVSLMRDEMMDEMRDGK